MDQELKRDGLDHYRGLVESFRREAAHQPGVELQDLETTFDDRCGIVLSIRGIEKTLRVMFFPEGDCTQPRLASTPFLIASEGNAGAFYVERSPYYRTRYWNTDIRVTGYVPSVQQDRDLVVDECDDERHYRFTNDQMARWVVRLLLTV